MNEQIKQFNQKDIQSGSVAGEAGVWFDGDGYSPNSTNPNPSVSSQAEGKAEENRQAKEEGNECNPPWQAGTSSPGICAGPSGG